jgi:hypothetical protein
MHAFTSLARPWLAPPPLQIPSLRAMRCQVDWSLVTDTEDVMWTAGHRETKAEISRRAKEFLKFVIQ